MLNSKTCKKDEQIFFNFDYKSKPDWDRMKPSKFGLNARKRLFSPNQQQNSDYQNLNLNFRPSRKKQLLPEVKQGYYKDFYPQIEIFPQKYKQTKSVVQTGVAKSADFSQYQYKMREKNVKDVNSRYDMKDESASPLFLNKDKGKKYGFHILNQDFHLRNEQKHFPPVEQRFLEDQKVGIQANFNGQLSRGVYSSIEKQMGRKKNLSQFSGSERRNGLELRSYGDKPYKYPDYAPNFFVNQKFLGEARLEARARELAKSMELAKNDPKQKKNKLNLWKDRLQYEKGLLDKESVMQIDSWEVFKREQLMEINPKYVDYGQHLNSHLEFVFFEAGFDNVKMKQYLEKSSPQSHKK